MIDIQVSIVIYKTPKEVIDRLIACILKSSLAIRIDVIDNWSADCPALLASDPRVSWMASGSNLGYGKGHNLSMQRSIDQARYHLVINPDVHFDSATLETLFHFMEREQAIGQVMPRIVNENGQLQYLCKLLPTPADVFVRRFIPFNSLKSRVNTKYELRNFGYDRVIRVPNLSGCFMLFRTSALKQIGVFDERYFMYAEDVDLTRRMHEKYFTAYYPDVTVMHEHARDSYKSLKMLLVHIGSLIKYFNKWGWFFDAERKEINLEVMNTIAKN